MCARKITQIAELLEKKRELESLLSDVSEKIKACADAVISSDGEGIYKSFIGNIKIAKTSRTNTKWSDLAKEAISEKKLLPLIEKFSSVSESVSVRIVK